MNFTFFIWIGVVCWVVINLAFSNCFKEVLIPYTIVLMVILTLYFGSIQMSEYLNSAVNKKPELRHNKLANFFRLIFSNLLSLIVAIAVVVGLLIAIEYVLMMFIGCYNIRSIVLDVVGLI